MPVSLSAKGIGCFLIAVAFPKAHPVSSLPSLILPQLIPTPFISPPPSLVWARNLPGKHPYRSPSVRARRNCMRHCSSRRYKSPGDSASPAVIHPADAFRVSAAASRTSHGFHQLRCLRSLLQQEEGSCAQCRLREQGGTQVRLLQPLCPPLVPRRGPSPVPGVQPCGLLLQDDVLSDG